jgi:ribonuclease III
MPSLKQLIERLGVPSADEQLIKAALTHSSFRNEHYEEDDLVSGERLEFLGDAILNYLTADLLYRQFPDQSEGQLTELRAALVRTSTLADFARKLDLGQYLRLSRGEEVNGARKRDSLLADTFEALLGAVFLDGGLETVRTMVLPFLEQRLAQTNPHALLDVRSILQERLQAERNITPHYTVLLVTGPEHRREYTTEVYAGAERLGEGRGGSKQAAAQAAAQAALVYLDIIS